MNPALTKNVSSNPEVAMSVDPAAAPPLPRLMHPEEIKELRLCETIIERGLETFMEVGSALGMIRSKRLYRAEFDTFEGYCQERWSMSARRALQFCDAAETVRNIAREEADRNNCSDSPVNLAPFALPATESQVRPLTLLPPEEHRSAWREAVLSAGSGRVTARHVQAVVDRRRGFVGASAAATGQGASTKPAPANDAGSREEQLRSQADAAIAEVRELIDAIGTADSSAAVGVSQALEQLQAFKDHVARMAKLQESRK